MVWLGPIILLLVGLGLIALFLTLGTARVLGQPTRRSGGWAAAHDKPMDPAEAGFDHETRLLQTPNGPLELWLLQGQSNTGPRVVIVHGWADGRVGALSWAPVLMPICQQIILFDLHGHGDSPQSKCDWGPKQNAAIQTILENLGDGPPIILLGLSWGGQLALRAALSSKRVKGVVMDGTGRVAKNAPREGMKQMGLPSWPAVDLAMAWKGRNIAKDLRLEITPLQSPLLMITGQQDTIAPPEDAEAIAKAATAGTCKIFPNAGHLNAACVDPEGYRQALQMFFKQFA